MPVFGSKIAVEAPCKVNLFLDLTGLTGNGYHLIDTVMQTVSLSDLIVISATRDARISLSCSDSTVPLSGDNLAARAARVLVEAAGLELGGLHIHIEKAVPMQAGLGGGSADAAAVLVGLNQLLEAGLSHQRLCEIGLSLGADVPYLIQGGCCRARGIGQQLSPLPLLGDCQLVIGKPDHGTGTAEAYALYDSLKAPAHQSPRLLLEGLESGSLGRVGEGMFNVFEQAVFPAGSAAIKEKLLRAGALGAVLSGSGSAVTGLFDTQTAAKTALDSIPQAFLATPTPHGARIVYSC